MTPISLWNRECHHKLSVDIHSFSFSPVEDVKSDQSKRRCLPAVYNLYAGASQLLTPSNTGIKNNDDQNLSSQDDLRLSVVYLLLY